MALGAAQDSYGDLPAILEPPPVFYGTITQSPTNTKVNPTTVEWQIETTGDSSTITATQVVTVDGTTYYISQIPFETRKLADNTALTTTPNTLEQTSSDSTYSRSAKVDGKTAVLPAGKGTFTYGTPSIGLIERIDLVVGETYAEWALRIFGDANTPRDEDLDNDGDDNEAEYLAGTDPKSGTTKSGGTLAPLPGGGLSITFPTATGKHYKIQRSTNLEQSSWTDVGTEIIGTGEPITYNITNPPPDKRLFYRIVASEE